MSNEDYGNSFTDDEIAAGVPGIVYGSDREDREDSLDLDDEFSTFEDDDFGQRKETDSAWDRGPGEYIEEEWVEGCRAIAGIKQWQKIQYRLCRKIMLNDLDYMVRRYAKKEAIPWEFVKAAYQSDCVAILIKALFRKVVQIPMNHDLNSEIVALSDRVVRNADMEIAYDRVALVQQFVHRKVSEVYGEGAQHELAAPPMRKLLSACRLNLNIIDIRSRGAHYLSYIANKSEEEAQIESTYPRSVTLRPGAQYRKTWKARHLRSLSFFARERSRRRSAEVKRVPIELPLEDYQKAVLQAYSRA